jgi:hypothetical protein
MIMMMVKAFLRYCIQKLGNMIEVMMRAYKTRVADPHSFHPDPDQGPEF